MAEKVSLLSPPKPHVSDWPQPSEMVSPQALNHQAAQRDCSRLDRYARSMVLRMLERIEHGGLLVRDPIDEVRVGNWADRNATAKVFVADVSFYRRILAGGSLAVAEAFIDGLWSCEDLTKTLRIFGRNLKILEALHRGPVRLLEPLRRFLHGLHRNTRSGARRNIAAHYDLSNEFFALFLDDTMTYSSGIFEDEDSTLRDASIAKYERICNKLRLTPNDHLLEIGSGWGGMAIHAAKNYGCRVTTTTISRQQFDLAAERIAQERLADRITLLAADYRDLTGHYDKLVSIEMVEAVGHEYLPTYLQKCSDLLKPDGLMCLQAITIPDHRYARYRRSVDFIRRYIFPGGCLLSSANIGRSLCRTDFRVSHWEDFSLDYAKTLACWRANFHARLDEIRALGYAGPFLRMWDYYLSYCEAGFRERLTGVSQIVFSKPACQRSFLPL
jgi:cyclopropane-fatty-acyl-phospholipid synthase